MSKKTIFRPEPEALSLPLVGADSHAHLNSPVLRDRLPHLIERAYCCGISSIGNVFLSTKEYEADKGLFDTFSQIFFLLGIHPYDAMQCTVQEIEHMRIIFKNDFRLKAVGEIGLDFYHQNCSRLLQEEAFRLQLSLAKDLKLPIIIHSRDAAEDTIRILESEGFIGNAVLWHCFSGDAVFFTDRILENGWSISIAGLVTFPVNKPLQEVIPRIPANRLLLETDCPYLTPVPWRGMQNEPAFIVFTASYIATIRDVEVIELWTECASNTKQFFKIS